MNKIHLNISETCFWEQKYNESKGIWEMIKPVTVMSKILEKIFKKSMTER